ncbi:hypothetical protein BJ508DRAFT_372024 [Ascobolus immersus RN42]|uniref:Uncharacterized protein n=1 Tax=Ascobolus immersus RN42 TaxID=1160509 RepID=A0A3N4INN8_ASCIM|nr:hypothetical protein BJ508DRAFT_372024 [Ascobolus immersus RN42]
MSLVRNSDGSFGIDFPNDTKIYLNLVYSTWELMEEGKNDDAISLAAALLNTDQPGWDPIPIYFQGYFRMLKGMAHASMGQLSLARDEFQASLQIWETHDKREPNDLANTTKHELQKVEARIEKELKPTGEASEGDGKHKFEGMTKVGTGQEQQDDHSEQTGN